MNTEYLEHSAQQLKVDKSPACRRAINRILAVMKKRCADGEYETQAEAESAFRKLVADERTCQKPAKAKAAPVR
jgi:hypothetical protein